MSFSWQKLIDLGEFVYKGVSIAKSVSSSIPKNVDPELHTMSRPYANLRGTQRLYRSGQNRGSSGYDTSGDRGALGVSTAPTTQFSSDIKFQLAQLRGLTRDL